MALPLPWLCSLLIKPVSVVNYDVSISGMSRMSTNPTQDVTLVTHSHMHGDNIAMHVISPCMGQPVDQLHSLWDSLLYFVGKILSNEGDLMLTLSSLKEEASLYTVAQRRNNRRHVWSIKLRNIIQHLVCALASCRSSCDWPLCLNIWVVHQVQPVTPLEGSWGDPRTNNPKITHAIALRGKER